MPRPDIPLVSVVIPTYNRRASLSVTLDALARQWPETPKFEVVVVSDGSTDGTNDELTARAAAGRDPFILSPIFQANGGPSRARNRGIQAARGEIVVFLDDDVEPVENLVAVHAAHHRDATDLAVIGPMYAADDMRWKEPVWVAWEHAMLVRQYDAWREGRWVGAGPNHFYSGNASLRRDHLLAVNGFDESFTRQEDVELAERLSSERHVTFMYDVHAAVTHRPVRRFESWLAIPFAYGRLDVTRANRSDDARESWQQIQCKAYADRNGVTRGLVQLLLLGVIPEAGGVVRSTLTGLSRVLYRCRRPSAAFALLSAVYNLRYVEGALAAVGGARGALKSLIVNGDPQPVRAAMAATGADSTQAPVDAGVNCATGEA